MKRQFPKKSKSHERKIRAITSIIVNCGKDKIAFIILFGSFARGDWVRDIYDERKDDGTVGYTSDYDILIVTKTKKQAAFGAANRLETKIKKELANCGITRYSDLLDHSVNIIIEPLERVNSKISKKHYFFSDIKKEGILLYDNGEFKIGKADKLNDKERKKIMKEDYEYWLQKGSSFFIDSNNACARGDYSLSAFYLHQATESLYNCTILVCTGYKPRTHYLSKLGKDCATQSLKFLSIFPQIKKEDKKCFELLQSAYVDARYDKKYSITKEQLKYLFNRIEMLKKVTKAICEEEIGEID